LMSACMSDIQPADRLDRMVLVAWRLGGVMDSMVK